MDECTSKKGFKPETAVKISAQEYKSYHHFLLSCSELLSDIFFLKNNGPESIKIPKVLFL